METKFNFKSQIATDKNQSERLLALGLKPETSDCYHWQETDRYGDGNGKWHCEILSEYNKDHNEYLYNVYGVDGSDEGFFIPAWGLNRLFEIMPKRIVFGCETFERILKPTSISYSPLNWPKEFARCCSTNENYFDCVIDCIAKLIEEGHFKKEYLEE